MQQELNIVVIGGIAAGMSVAAKAKRENPQANITVIEKENYISFGACGLPYYLGGQFDDPQKMFARTPEMIEKSGINLLLESEATAVDTTRKIVTYRDKSGIDQEIAFDRLMIATGASANRLPFEGMDAPNLYLHTKLRDAEALKAKLDQYRSIAIIGGGFIGVEVADQLALLGKKVTLLQNGDAIMQGPFDPEFSHLMQEALEAEGVDLRLQQNVTGFQLSDGKIVAVKTEMEKITVDAVVVAIGFRPNTDFLTDPQLKKLPNGAILINPFGETSIEGIFSAGDCASIYHRQLGDRYIPLATYANKMGRIIGSNIVRSPEHYIAFPGALGSSMIKVGQYEAGSTGLTEKMAKQLEESTEVKYKSTLIKTANHTDYYPGQEELTIKLVYREDNHRLVGAQIFGKKDAALRLHALSVAIHAELSTEELGFLDLGYAPPFTTTWEAINIAANRAK